MANMWRATCARACATVDGFDDYGQLLDVVEAMHKRGLSEADVEKVLGGNWLRVFEQVWDA